MNGNEGTCAFQICTHAEAFCAKQDSTLCNSTLMKLLSVRDRLRLEREETATARLQRRHQREQEGRRSEWTEVRQTRLDRRRIHGRSLLCSMDPSASS